MASAGTEKLQRMRDFIESRESGGEAGKGKRDALDLEKAASRIRAHDKKSSAVPSALLSPDNRGLLGESQHKLDFSKPMVELGGSMKSVFSSWRGFFSGAASFLSRTPFAANLANSLECAGLQMSVETFLVISSLVAVGAAALTFAVFLAVSVAYGDAFFAAVALLAAFFVAVLFSVLPFTYLSIRASSRAKAIDRVLPFALMQIATQVRAGVSFHRSLESVANADYGILSAEFKKLTRDLQQGLSTEDALTRLYNRTKSQPLRKSLLQVIRSFKTGGNLSKIINEIAQDVSLETQMSIRDFTEKLNFINVIFIMVAVVAPVSATVLSAILQIPLFSSGLPSYFIYAAFGGITLAMVALLYVIKQLEPAAW